MLGSHYHKSGCHRQSVSRGSRALIPALGRAAAGRLRDGHTQLRPSRIPVVDGLTYPNIRRLVLQTVHVNSNGPGAKDVLTTRSLF